MSKYILDKIKRYDFEKTVLTKTVANHATFHQNRLRGFGFLSPRGRNLPFPMLCLALLLIQSGPEKMYNV